MHKATLYKFTKGWANDCRLTFFQFGEEGDEQPNQTEVVIDWTDLILIEFLEGYSLYLLCMRIYMENPACTIGLAWGVSPEAAIVSSLTFALTTFRRK